MKFVEVAILVVFKLSEINCLLRCKNDKMERLIHPRKEKVDLSPSFILTLLLCDLFYKHWIP